MTTALGTTNASLTVSNGRSDNDLITALLNTANIKMNDSCLRDRAHLSHFATTITLIA